MRSVPLLTPPEQRWTCPNCPLEQVTREARPHSRMHACRGLFGLTVPMVPAGTRCKIEAVEREDYINGECVQLAPETGRPVMAAVTTREDGQDCTVYAPAAIGHGRAH
jgi:hypothetical protein